jgi:hypothetical protein
MSLTTNIKIRAGFPRREVERSLLIIGENKDGFLKIEPLLKDLVERYVRLKIILSTQDKELANWLRQTYPDHRIFPLPLDNPISIELFLFRSNIRTAITLDTVPAACSGMINGLERRSIALVLLKTLKEGGPQITPKIERACEVLVDLVATEVAPTGVKHRRLTVPQFSDMLREMLGRDLKLKREQNSQLPDISDKLLRLSKHQHRKRLVNWRLLNYPGTEEIATALDHPDTIMCLGNGPSSEDERLSTMSYDMLFRVNHSWRQRGLFQQPDVVFTGSRRSMRAVGDVIFGLQSENAERRLVATRFFAPSLKPTRFFNVATISPRLIQFDWGILRPTNGASMLAAAVALQPKKLIVAGIDLFQHPEGSYPGDKSTPNEFSPAHSLVGELGFIRELFDTYQGELVIISDILRDRLSQHANEKGS